MTETRSLEWYKENHRAVYPGGYINKTITMSLEAKQALENAGIRNWSIFINDLILFSLKEDRLAKQQWMANANALKAQAKQFGFQLFIDVDPDAQKKDYKDDQRVRVSTEYPKGTL